MTSAGTELVNGRPAHKLTGIARSTYGTGRVTNVRATTVWIDVETLLVRKLFEESPRGTLPGTRSRVTTVFEPRANPPMEDDRFRFALPSQK
jgi:hypothetical protein